MERITKLPPIQWALRHKQVVGSLTIIASLTFLGIFIANNPAILHTVITTSPMTLGILFILYCCLVLTNVAITYVTVRLCQKELSFKNSLLLTMYSTVVNFFGPLQSGPGVRALYLKTKIGLRIRDYMYFSLFYYAAFASINASLLFVHTLPLLTAGIIALGVILIIVMASRMHTHSARHLIAIYVVTLVQSLLMVAIYYTELHATHTMASLWQGLIYGSSANLSLFVSITPGAIGIREAFILFAQSLHHISLSSVITAGILDRAFYVVFLLALLVISSVFHLNDTLLRKKKA